MKVYRCDLCEKDIGDDPGIVTVETGNLVFCITVVKDENHVRQKLELCRACTLDGLEEALREDKR